MGIPDPLEFIEAESNRVPFKSALVRPHAWQDAFENWPLPPIAGWRNWYKRILENKSIKTSNWDNLRIAQCLELSLAETPKNENLLIAACHFWSNGVRAFLNMWLCKFIFCGKANEPTLNHIAMAEDLATGHCIPLGKYLLGSVYHMLHQTTHLMYTSQKISCVNGPWWFIQMWLQLYMHMIVGVNLNNRHFPSPDYKEGENQITKGCQSYGEAASTIIIDQNISQLFELFFRGFTNPFWLPYLHNDNLTLPYEFSFENGCNDARSIEIFNIFIHPCILPAEFCGGRQNHSTYEYY
jgi:hypothetical protein